jgi:hemoglobin/transferrin/lactoferrin receptor protein
MPLMGNIGIRWVHPEGKFWVEGIINAASKADRLSTRDKADTNRIPPGGTPSYIVPSLRGGWQANEHLQLTLALENLTDTEYRIHGSGVNEPGFHAVMGATVTW